jgi:pilus assembly protein CpaB
VSGFLFPGSRVDVLVTMRPANGRDAMTTTVLQDVLVLSTGAKLEPDAGGKPQSVKEVKDVTVLVTPEQAAKLVLAIEQGTVQFVLRNGADEDELEPKTVELRELQGVHEVAAVAARVVRNHEAPKATSGFEAETFVGTKKNVVKF